MTSASDACAFSREMTVTPSLPPEYSIDGPLLRGQGRPSGSNQRSERPRAGCLIPAFDGAVDGHEQIELAFCGLHLGYIHLKEADGVCPELSLGPFVTLDLGQARDAVALLAAVQGGAGELRDGGLQGLEPVVQRQQGVAPEGTMGASCSGDSVDHCSSRGPVGRSATEVRLRHLATVFGFTS